jgi:hypothetical protein
MVYTNPETKVRTFVAWNPTDKQRAVMFFEGKKALGQTNVPPRGIVSVVELLPVK